MVMTPRHALGAPRPQTPVSQPRAPFFPRLMIVILALAGFTTLMYPTAGNWFTDRAHASVISGYTQTIDSMPAGERAAELQRARLYNASLGQGHIDDPYGSAATASNEVVAADYLEQLSLTTSTTMARIRIPTADIALPVYHGTDDETLSRGVGHLQGSALPVGGLGTNSVLTGHSGVPQADLFTGLHDVEIGDRVYIDVMGTTLTYQVDKTQAVLPTETDLLQPIPDKDLLTLITCTPIGVNTHRLIVQAHRITDTDALADTTALAGATAAGFPWWAVVLGSAIVAGVVFLCLPYFSRRKKSVPRHHRRLSTPRRLLRVDTP
jgi:sortase A